MRRIDSRSRIDRSKRIARVAGCRRRKVLPADYIARRALYLPERARYDWIMQQAAVSGADLPKLVNEAMTAIESGFEPLAGVLPKEYGIFEGKVLEDLMRLFNSEQIKQATGDVFGRIYEYFLAEFSVQKAHDNGEFFTPSSIVQTIVNVIEPDHGTVFDPACASGGMFVQSSVPCELWHFDRAKPPERRDKVLMLDARNVFRKVTRKINDFSPEQMQNLAAIVWLYRGQQARFLALIKEYVGRVCSESAAVAGTLAPFDVTLGDLRGRFEALASAVADDTSLDTEKQKALAAAVTELGDALAPYEADRNKLLADLSAFGGKYATALPRTNDEQHAARKTFDPHAEAARGLVKQVDLLYKLAARVADAGSELAADEAIAAVYDRRAVGRLVKQLDVARKVAVEQLKQPAYFHKQVAWLQARFPNAELEAVAGLVKLVDRAEIEAADWSLTPGRYVGVAPAEEDEDFDFEQTLRDIHMELFDLNKEAAALAAKIQENFEGRGA